MPARKDRVEVLIEAGRWVDARRAIEAELTDRPADHWLLTRLSTTFYEMGDYDKALELADKALAIAPSCPLALWDRAGALDMLGRESDALEVYLGLLRRGVESIADDECGEGEDWAAGLVADCLYRAACCMEDLGQKARAAELHRRYLKLLDLGVSTIYDRQDAAARLRKLTGKAEVRAGVRQALEGVLSLVGA